jgi:hypothetical protein
MRMIEWFALQMVHLGCGWIMPWARLRCWAKERRENVHMRSR